MNGAEAQRYRALLDERSAALAARGIAERNRGERRDYLVCSVGGERYGVPLAAAAAVMPDRSCTPVPGAPPALRGILAHAGVIVSVIDLGQALGVRRNDDGQDPGHFLRLRADSLPNAPPVAFAVDRVLGLASVLVEAIEAPALVATPGGLGAEAISGYAPIGSEGEGGERESFAVIDLPCLLRPFLS